MPEPARGQEPAARLHEYEIKIELAGFRAVMRASHVRARMGAGHWDSGERRMLGGCDRTAGLAHRGRPALQLAPECQYFSLFINTVKLTRSGIILAFPACKRARGTSVIALGEGQHARPIRWDATAGGPRGGRGGKAEMIAGKSVAMKFHQPQVVAVRLPELRLPAPTTRSFARPRYRQTRSSRTCTRQTGAGQTGTRRAVASQRAGRHGGAVASSRANGVCRTGA